jgi:hypothetical protein
MTTEIQRQLTEVQKNVDEQLRKDYVMYKIQISTLFSINSGAPECPLSNFLRKMIKNPLDEVITLEVNQVSDLYQELAHIEEEAKFNTEFTKLKEKVNTIQTSIDNLYKLYEKIVNGTTISKPTNDEKFDEVLNKYTEMDNNISIEAITTPSIFYMFDYLVDKKNILYKRADKKAKYYKGIFDTNTQAVCYWTVGFFAYVYNWCSYKDKVDNYEAFKKNNLNPAYTLINGKKENLKSALRILKKLNTFITDFNSTFVKSEINKCKGFIDNYTRTIATLFDKLELVK